MISKRKTPANQSKKYSPEVLNEEEIERILKVQSKITPTGRAFSYIFAV